MVLLFLWFLLIKRKESFVDPPGNEGREEGERKGEKENVNESHPDIPQMLKQVQSILGKISSPELIAHITSVADKDPGELARLLATQQK